MKLWSAVPHNDGIAQGVGCHGWKRLVARRVHVNAELTAGASCDLSTYDPGTGDIDIEWTAGVNGILSSSSDYNSSRLTTAIGQAFEQSPYLEKE